MEISVKLDIQDWKTYQTYLEKNLSARNKPWLDSLWFNLVSWFVISLVFFTFIQGTDEFNWTTAGVVSLFFIFIYVQLILSGVKIKRAFEPLPEGSFCGRHTFHFNDNGIHSEGKGYHGEHSWSLVQRIERTNDAIYIFMDSALAFIFPLCQLEDPEGFYEFVSSKRKM